MKRRFLLFYIISLISMAGSYTAGAQEIPPEDLFQLQIDNLNSELETHTPNITISTDEALYNYENCEPGYDIYTHKPLGLLISEINPEDYEQEYQYAGTATWIDDFAEQHGTFTKDINITCTKFLVDALTIGDNIYNNVTVYRLHETSTIQSPRVSEPFSANHYYYVITSDDGVVNTQVTFYKESLDGLLATGPYKYIEYAGAANKSAGATNQGIVTYSQEIALFPNPANNILNISLKKQVKLSEVTQVRMKDISGKLVKEVSMNNEPNTYSKAYQVDMSQVSNGLYFVEIINGSTTSNHKLLIQKN